MISIQKVYVVIGLSFVLVGSNADGCKYQNCLVYFTFMKRHIQPVKTQPSNVVAQICLCFVNLFKNLFSVSFNLQILHTHNNLTSSQDATFYRCAYIRVHCSEHFSNYNYLIH